MIKQIKQKRNLVLVAVFLSILLGLLLANNFAAAQQNLIRGDTDKFAKLESGKETKFIVKEDGSLKKSLNFQSHKKKLGSTEYYEVELTKEEAESLVNSGADVYFPRTFKASLQDSVRIINATGSWASQYNSLNLTGIGQTVCVLDTGINYNHPDLGGCYGNNNPSSSCKVLGGKDYVNNDNNPMDDNHHGTHVAGIVAANGTVKGVAPDAKLIAMKVLDSNGDGTDIAIINGIDWCVRNMSRYNISVISMSLGTETVFNNYCDSYDPPLAAAINDAVGNGISVVIATGNSGSSTGISLPACIRNSTRVAATDKTDTIASYSDRNNLVKLVAPGSSITSTWYTGGYGILSGTSMATPHVAGAIAIMNQYLNASVRKLSPQEIENALYTTGKPISDGSNTFSRINLLSAINSIDQEAPSVSLGNPENNTRYFETNLFFNCSARDISLKNASLIIWNSTSVFNQTNFNFNERSFENISVNLTNIRPGSYSWNCEFRDTNSNIGRNIKNQSFEILEINLSSPPNNLVTKVNNSFSCEMPINLNLSNVTFNLWNSSGLENTSIKSIENPQRNFSFEYNFTHDGNYSWNCIFNNINSTIRSAVNNNTIIYDTTAPILNLSSPVNEWYNKLKINLTLDEPGQCFFNYNGSNVSLGNGSSYYYEESLSLGQYNVTISCNDSLGNENSSLRSFEVDLEKPTVEYFTISDGLSFTGARELEFNYSSSDNLNLSSCSLVMNGVIMATQEINNSQNRSFLYNPGTGNFVWAINCTDIAGNVNNSGYRSLVINSPPSSGGGGSGGGGGGGGISASTTNSTNTKSNTTLPTVRNNIPHSSGRSNETNQTSEEPEKNSASTPIIETLQKYYQNRKIYSIAIGVVIATILIIILIIDIRAVLRTGKISSHPEEHHQTVKKKNKHENLHYKRTFELR
jgi:subtilisin family serine protease